MEKIIRYKVECGGCDNEFFMTEKYFSTSHFKSVKRCGACGQDYYLGEQEVKKEKEKEKECFMGFGDD